MIEPLIVEHLSDKLSVFVGLEHPDKKQDSYVVFEKTGSTRSNHLIGSMFAFQSYANSKFEASVLNQKVIDAILSLEYLNRVVSVKLNSDYDFTDTETKRYRYQAVFLIKHY